MQIFGGIKIVSLCSVVVCMCITYMPMEKGGNNVMYAMNKNNGYVSRKKACSWYGSGKKEARY